MTPGDVLGHEPMGIVEAIGPAVTDLAIGDRWWFRSTSPAATASCVKRVSSRSARRPRCTNTTAVRRCSATPSSTARCRAVRRSCCVSRTRTTGRSRCLTVRPTTASCSCPTCCRRHGRASQYAAVPAGGSLVVLGLGPIGDMACRIALHRGIETVIGIDLVPSPPRAESSRGVEVLDLNDYDKQAELVEAVRGLTNGPRSRCGHRRGRHGSARFAGSESRARRDRSAAERGRREADEEGGRRPARRAAQRRSNWCAAAARCRCSGSTAG